MYRSRIYIYLARACVQHPKFLPFSPYFAYGIHSRHGVEIVRAISAAEDTILSMISHRIRSLMCVCICLSWRCARKNNLRWNTIEFTYRGKIIKIHELWNIQIVSVHRKNSWYYEKIAENSKNREISSAPPMYRVRPEHSKSILSPRYRSLKRYVTLDLHRPLFPHPAF